MSLGETTILNYGNAQIRILDGTVTEVNGLEQFIDNKKGDSEIDQPSAISNGSSSLREQEKIIWYSEYGMARSAGREERKPLLINFTGSDWCGWCKKLDAEVFSTEEFKAYAEDNLILLKLDFPRHTPQQPSVMENNKRLAQHFGVNAFPTVILLNYSGQQKGRLGYIRGGPEAFITKLKELL